MNGEWKSSLYRFIHGYASRGATYSGLLKKCPAIAYTDRTITSQDVESSGMVRRRTNAYTFDRDLFLKWCMGGAVWIDDDPDGDGDYPSALQQSFSNPSAVAEGYENDALNADF